ncbi:MAG: hypothetical protein ACF8SC_03220 [Phycisphaerales bacterium JB037]
MSTPTPTPTTTTPTERTGQASPIVALWASAFVLAGLVLTQADRLIGTRAQAEMVSRVGGYTVLTADGGTDEVLILLDHRTEELFVYSIENQNNIELDQRLDVVELFRDAKAKAGGN